MANQKPATETDEVSGWYERCVEWLIWQSGLSVRREPRIGGQTPDLLVTQPNGTEIIIECLVKMKEPEHAKEFMERNFHMCGGDVRELHQNIYSRLVEKAAKYKGIAAGPYIVALYDDECMPYVGKAYDLIFSAHVPYLSFDSVGNVVDRGWRDMWSTLEKPEGIFRRYPHVSGLLYSRWPREHYYLPNPLADIPVSADLFPFACVPEAPLLPNGQPIWEQRDRLVRDTYDFPPNTLWRQVELLSRAVGRIIEQKAASDAQAAM